MKTLRLPLYCFSLMLCGCVILPIPHERQITPALTGTIKDSATGKAISGVSIKVISFLNKHSKEFIPPVEVTSNDSGQYYIISKQAATWWFVVLLGPFEGMCGGMYSVSKAGYKPTSFEYSYLGASNFDGQCSSRPIKRDIELDPISNQ